MPDVVKVFVSYSHKDSRYLEDDSLLRQGIDEVLHSLGGRPRYPGTANFNAMTPSGRMNRIPG